MTTHAKFSPSSASRWCKCPASLRLVEEHSDLVNLYQAKKDNSSAEEGTKAHALLEGFLTGAKVEVDNTEMLAHVKWAVEVIKSLVPKKASLSNLFLCEKKVIFSPEVYGTADCLIYDSIESTLNIIDFKYGVHSVLAKENYQLGIYALGAIRTWALTPKKIILHILQPRHMSGERAWVSWTVDFEWLKNLKREVYNAVTNVSVAKPVMGDHCRWCPAKPVCPAIQSEVTEAFKTLTNNESTFENIVEIYKKRQAVDEWFKSAETLIQAKLESGESIKGVFLKEGVRRMNYNKDLKTEEIIEKLEELGFDSKEIYKNEKKVLPLSVIRGKINIDQLIDLGLVQVSVTKSVIEFGDVMEELVFDAVED